MNQQIKETKIKTLEIKWSTSRAKDSYGWNICTLIENDRKYKTCGGGYDMLGTVLANWVQENYMKQVIENLNPCVYDNNECTHSDYYGFFYHKDSKKYWLDGACGCDCIKKIMKHIGLQLNTICNKKGHATHYIITETIKC